MSQGLSELTLLNAMTDDELSAELHRRRKVSRETIEKNMVKFSEQLIVLLDEFEKLSGGKRIVRGNFGGYRVEDKK